MRYPLIQNRTQFHNLQNSTNHFKYFYLLNYSEIWFHIHTSKCGEYRWFQVSSIKKKIPGFFCSILLYEQCEFMLELFNMSLYFEISKQNIFFTFWFLLINYINFTECKKTCFVTKLCKCLKINSIDSNLWNVRNLFFSSWIEKYYNSYKR